jgi:rfaE bifunctional protein kinase chain/domain
LAKPGSQERPDPERLTEIVRSFSGRRIVVLGDLVSDEFVYADIDRVSREAPVLILNQRRTVAVPGGGGNSAANLRALGATPVPVGVVGRDAGGQRLINAFRQRRVPTTGIARHADYQTPTKSRILAGGVHTRRQQIVRLDSGSPRGELTAAQRKQVARLLRAALKGADGLLIADYSYGAASPQLVEDLVPRLIRSGLTVTVDSRARLVQFHGLTACTPNQEELEQALGSASLADRDIPAGGRKLLGRTGNQAVLVTRGAKGMSLFRRRRPTVEIPAYGSGEVADVTGAGDTVIAVFTLALAVGADVVDAARLSNYAAGLVVTKAGTATIDQAELVAAIHGDA